MVVDTILVAATGTAALASLILAYHFGAEAWKDWFLLDTGAGHISGIWTEFFVIGASLATLVLILVATGHSGHGLIGSPATGAHLSVLGIVTKWAPWSYVPIGLTVAIYPWHVLKVQRNAGAKAYPRVALLMRGYLVYFPYALILYTLWATTVIVIIDHFVATAAEYRQWQTMWQARLPALDDRAAIVRVVTDKERGLGWLLEAFDGNIAIGGNYVSQQMAPLIAFVFMAISVLIIIRISFLRRAFVDNSFAIVGILFFIILVLLGVSGYVYFSIYLVDVDQAINLLARFQGTLDSVTPDTLRRYDEVLLELRRRDSLSGFVTMISTETGVPALVLAGIQWLASRVEKALQDKLARPAPPESAATVVALAAAMETELGLPAPEPERAGGLRQLGT